MKKIAVGSIVLLAAVAIAWAGAADAADFPKKRLTYNICFNPGGESDITARFQEQPLKKYLGAGCGDPLQDRRRRGPLLGGTGPEPRPTVTRSPVTIFPTSFSSRWKWVTPGTRPWISRNIYMFESTPNVLTVRKDSPYKTLKDFVEYAKNNPPGVVTVGGSGSSSANDLGTAMLNKTAGIKLTYIPFGGTGSAVPALLGGHVTALMTYSPMVVQYKTSSGSLPSLRRNEWTSSRTCRLSEN